MRVVGAARTLSRVRVPLALRLVGYGLLLVVLVATAIDFGHIRRTELTLWVAAFTAFATAFHIGASAPVGARSRRFAALAVVTPAMLAMAALLPCNFGALSLVIVASQAALVLTPPQAIAWILAQTVVLGYFLCQVYSLDNGVAALIALLGFQGFAAVAVYVARREAEARQALAFANAELRATRSLLEEASRVNERTRIARELHDVLGHDLTALGLQLEIATHVAGDQVPVHVAKARDVNARLLRNVRGVVSAMRASEGPDLREALRTLVEDLPGLTVHLGLPDRLVIDDAARAHCVLRCVQEIVTNTLRHARAENLWITIEQHDGTITVETRDDGRGADAVNAGNGLSGMRARLEELGGFLRIAPAPSFAVIAQLPQAFGSWDAARIGNKTVREDRSRGASRPVRSEGQESTS
jgi:signal transduction histidine kinase